MNYQLRFNPIFLLIKARTRTEVVGGLLVWLTSCGRAKEMSPELSRAGRHLGGGAALDTQFRWSDRSSPDGIKPSRTRKGEG